jgi:hypothetical protein
MGERAANEVINLPLHTGVSMDEAERIVNFVCKHAVRPAVAERRQSPSGVRVATSAMPGVIANAST